MRKRLKGIQKQGKNTQKDFKRDSREKIKRE
jgi:hypothetical protein